MSQVEKIEKEITFYKEQLAKVGSQIDAELARPELREQALQLLYADRKQQFDLLGDCQKALVAALSQKGTPCRFDRIR
jgi:hypothetical protein